MLHVHPYGPDTFHKGSLACLLFPPSHLPSFGQPHLHVYSTKNTYTRKLTSTTNTNTTIHPIYIPYPLSPYPIPSHSLTFTYIYPTNQIPPTLIVPSFLTRQSECQTYTYKHKIQIPSHKDLVASQIQKQEISGLIETTRGCLLGC